MGNTGLVDEDGKPLPQLNWLGAWVMVKKNGKWLNAAFFSRPIQSGDLLMWESRAKGKTKRRKQGNKK